MYVSIDSIDCIRSPNVAQTQTIRYQCDSWTNTCVLILASPIKCLTAFMLLIIFSFLYLLLYHLATIFWRSNASNSMPPNVPILWEFQPLQAFKLERKQAQWYEKYWFHNYGLLWQQFEQFLIITKKFTIQKGDDRSVGFPWTFERQEVDSFRIVV